MADAVDHTAELERTAAALTARGKGILACDESVSTLGKRLVAAGLTNDAETRRAWREVLLTADNACAYGGAILFSETLAQRASCGTPFPALLAAKGVLPGVKVDLGLTPLPGSPDETTTTGLSDLRARADAFYAQGARFAKWRAALRVDPARGLPSDAAVRANADALADYARVALAAGLLPIVEPEVLIDGAHDMPESAAVGACVIAACYDALRARAVPLRLTLLKPMMVLPGRLHARAGHVPAPDVARATLDMLRACVPHDVPGVMFLSGGMGEAEATRNLAALSALGRAEAAPWALSFSFGRALQSSVLKLWAAGDAPAARDVAGRLAAANGAAQAGVWDGTHPSVMDGALYEGFRGWRGPPAT